MSDLSKEQVLHVAKLARLHMSDEEAQEVCTKMQSILSYVEELQEIDLHDVEELQHVPGLTNVLRTDEEVFCDAQEARACRKEFPRRSEDLLEVQAVFESRTE